MAPPGHQAEALQSPARPWDETSHRSLFPANMATTQEPPRPRDMQMCCAIALDASEATLGTQRVRRGCALTPSTWGLIRAQRAPETLRGRPHPDCPSPCPPLCSAPRLLCWPSECSLGQRGCPHCPWLAVTYFMSTPSSA